MAAAEKVVAPSPLKMEMGQAKEMFDLTLGTYELSNCSVTCGCPHCLYVASETFTNSVDAKGYSYSGESLGNGVCLLWPHVHVLFDLPFIWCAKNVCGGDKENPNGKARSPWPHAFRMDHSSPPLTLEAFLEAYNSQTPLPNTGTLTVTPGCGAPVEWHSVSTMKEDGLHVQLKDPKGKVLSTTKITYSATGDTATFETPMKGCVGPCTCICIPYTDTKVYKRISKPAA